MRSASRGEERGRSPGGVGMETADHDPVEVMCYTVMPSLATSGVIGAHRRANEGCYHCVAISP